VCICVCVKERERESARAVESVLATIFLRAIRPYVVKSWIAHTNESCLSIESHRAYEHNIKYRVVSHIRMSHVTSMNEA